MDDCTAINFVIKQNVNFFIKQNVNFFLSSMLTLFALHNGICGSFHNKATIHTSALHCVLWQNLDKDNFDMLYKNDGWTAIPNPIWTTNVPYERQINMLSSTNNNFLIFLFDIERFRIESRFLFLYIFFYSHCILVVNLPCMSCTLLHLPACHYVYLHFIVILYQIYSCFSLCSQGII